MSARHSLAITVITYQRPELLRLLLQSLQRQQAPDDCEVRVIVVDNDAAGTAHEDCGDIEGPFPVSWQVEPDPGIPAARQRSVDLAEQDDYVIFIDDDEQAPDGWLARIWETMQRTGADVVTGPVRGVLPPDAPSWARHSDVYSSVGKHETGTRLRKAYTNNTIVARRVLDAVQPAFHPAFRFTGSSDLHLFLRVSKAGFTIVWDDDAEVVETVPWSRLSLRWLVRRAFRSGSGDTISRVLIDPRPRTYLLCTGLGIARAGSGLALAVLGIASPSARIKGLRRIASAAGSLAGLWGVNYAEYQRP